VAERPCNNMPYTIAELENNQYFQTLENRDIAEYENQMARDREQFAVSGSSTTVSQTLRNSKGVFISYEDKQTELGMQGPWQEVVVSNQSTNIRTDEMLDLVIDRNIGEL